MNLKRLLWFNGYDETFDSPYPIEKCVEILRDNSAYDYIRRVKKALPQAFISYIRTNQKTLPQVFISANSTTVLVDIYPEADGRYTFLIRNMNINTHREIRENSLEYRGTLEPLENGTRVSGHVANTQTDVGCFLLLLMGLGGIIVMAMSSIYAQAGIPPVLLGVVMTILVALWGILIYASSDIIDYPKQLLGGHIPPRPDDIVPAWWNITRREFHFYTEQPLATCIQKLEGEAYHPHYQACALGMVKGKISSDHYFIAFEHTSSDKVYFCIDDNGLSHFNEMSEYLLGTLTAEGTGTRITGITGYRLGELWIFAPIWVIITAVLWVLYAPLAIGVGMMLILLGIISVRWEVTKLTKIPAQKLLGTAPKSQKSNWRKLWFGFRGDIDFITPYPIEDCYNMLFDYAPADDFSHTQWGDTPGNILDNQIFIGTYHQDEGHLDFVMKSVDKPLIPKLRGYGSLKTEGHYTHITGQVRCVDGWKSYIQGVIVSWVIWLIIFGMLFNLNPSLETGIWVIIGGIFAWIAWLYVRVIRQVNEAKGVLESYLGTNMNRKRKVADMEGE